MHTHTHRRVHTKADSHVLLEREREKKAKFSFASRPFGKRSVNAALERALNASSNTHTHIYNMYVCVCICWLAAHHNKSVLSEIHCRLNVNRKILFSMFFQLLFLYSVWRTQAYPVKCEVCRQLREGYACRLRKVNL